jgi:hypothetical protein
LFPHKKSPPIFGGLFLNRFDRITFDARRAPFVIASVAKQSHTEYMRNLLQEGPSSQTFRNDLSQDYPMNSCDEPFKHDLTTIGNGGE